MLILNRTYCSYLSFLLLPLFLLFSSSTSEDSNRDKAIAEVPVLKVNFYLMGYNEDDQEVFLQIGSNMDYLNQEFEGMVGFELNELYTDVNSVWLPELYEDIYHHDSKTVNEIVAPLENAPGINVFVFPTYCKEGTDQALMGFTPILKASQEKYQNASPSFDRIYIAYDGLENQTTLPHEMGHFLGLKHPWELSKSRKYMMGLKTAFGIARNHMNYGSEVEEFTLEQLRSMNTYALKYRKYLASKIITVRP